MFKTNILNFHGAWSEVLDDCRATVGKDELGKEPSTKFKKEILISEHSPIRNIEVRWKWLHIPSWVATHWVRHIWSSFVKTQRTDRTGTDRTKLPQDNPVTFTGVANIQHTIDTWRKRLCFMASPETREYAEDFKMKLHTTEPEWADVLVPNCVYRGFCPEPGGCNLWNDLSKHMTKNELMSWETRYGAYNRWLAGRMKFDQRGSL